MSHNRIRTFNKYITNRITYRFASFSRGPFASLQVLSGDGQCEVGGYSCYARANFTRLHFTKFAFADEWDKAGLKAQKPAFFNGYIGAYNPNGQQPAGEYGYTRPTSDAMLSYDATLALLTASKMALKTPKSSLTPNDMLQGLRQITGAHTLQGVSGRSPLAAMVIPSTSRLSCWLWIHRGAFMKSDCKAVSW